MNFNVGIGTTAPSVALDVNGEINSTYGFYHDRGDASTWDFTTPNFITNGNWYDLNLSSIVPAGVKAVALRVTIKDDQVDSWMDFRKKGNTFPYNTGTIRTQTPNVYNDGDFIVPCDSNRVIQYRAISRTFTTSYVIVKGWWK